MGDKSTEIHNPVREVQISGNRSIEVKELTWPVLLSLISEATVSGETGLPGVLNAFIRNSTSLSDEDIGNLSPSDGLKLLDAALDLNFNNEFLETLKKILEKIANFNSLGGILKGSYSGSKGNKASTGKT